MKKNNILVMALTLMPLFSNAMERSYPSCLVLSLESSTDGILDGDYVSLDCGPEFDRTVDAKIMTPGQHSNLSTALIANKKVSVKVYVESQSVGKDKYELRSAIVTR